MIERYPPSKYANAFGADMFISPPSNSGSTISDSHEPPDYKVCSVLIVLKIGDNLYSSIWREVSACLGRTRRAIEATLAILVLVVFTEH